MTRIKHDEHTRAMALLLKKALGQAVDPAAEKAAQQHVVGCDVCWPRFRQWAETLLGEPLPAGEEGAGDLPAVPTFGERWRLQQQAQEAVTRPGRWQRGAGYLARLSEGLVQETTALLVSLRQLLVGPSLALAHRGPAEVTLRCADLHDLEAVVTVSPDATDARLARVAVEVSIPSHWPDFSGVRVILDDGGWRAERITGRSGRVEFDGISAEKVSDLDLIILPPKQ